MWVKVCVCLRKRIISKRCWGLNVSSAGWSQTIKRPVLLMAHQVWEYHCSHSKLEVSILSFVLILLSVQSRTKLNVSLSMLHHSDICSKLFLLATFCLNQKAREETHAGGQGTSNHASRKRRGWTHTDSNCWMPGPWSFVLWRFPLSPQIE